MLPAGSVCLSSAIGFIVSYCCVEIAGELKSPGYLFLNIYNILIDNGDVDGNLIA